MHKLVRSIVSMAAHRFRILAVVELENLALRNQLHVLRRERLDHVVIFNERHFRRILSPVPTQNTKCVR